MNLFEHELRSLIEGRVHPADVQVLLGLTADVRFARNGRPQDFVFALRELRAACRDLDLDPTPFERAATSGRLPDDGVLVRRLRPAA